jgi:predicted dehydrogenase
MSATLAPGPGYPRTVTVVRVGVLGAARIAPNAILKPARVVDEVAVTAVAARDPARAAQFAARWEVPTVHRDYAAVISDAEVDAVYVPLPNSLHAQWTLEAITAGKHVLCEKPLTSNAVQARTVANAAAGSGLVVMEAFHYRYHPLMRRVLGLLSDGAIGAVRHIETQLCFPLPVFSDIRYRLDLAGGALMDAGCYAVHCLRQLGTGEPEVVDARARMRSPGVDRAMTASLRFPDGATGRIICSLWSRRLLGVSARVVGHEGELKVFNFVAPHLYHRLTVRTSRRRWSERVAGEPTYTCQLRAFAAAVRGGGEVLTPASDAVHTMQLIDDIYRAAGLQPRGA